MDMQASSGARPLAPRRFTTACRPGLLHTLRASSSGSGRSQDGLSSKPVRQPRPPAPPARPPSTTLHHDHRPGPKRARGTDANDEDPHARLAAMVADPSLQTPKDITLAMRRLVQHAQHGTLSADERAVMDGYAALLLPMAMSMPDIRDPVIALFSFARGQYWPQQLTRALWARLEARDYEMLRDPRQANGQSYGNLGYIIKSAAEAAGKGDAAAAAIVQRAGGVMRVLAAVIKGDERPTNVTLTPQGARSLLLACAALPHGHDHVLLSKLSAVNASQEAALNGQEVSNTLHAYGALFNDHNFRAPESVVRTLCTRGCELLVSGQMTPQGVSLSVVAMALLRYYEPAFIQGIDEALGASAAPRGFWSPHDCASVVRAFGVLGHTLSPTALQHILGALRFPLEQAGGRPQFEACKLLNGLLLMEGNQLRQHLPTAQRLMQEAHRFPPNSFSQASLQQLWQVHEAAQRMQLPGLALRGELLAAARDAAVDLMEKAVSSSQHSQVKAALRRVAVEVHEEARQLHACMVPGSDTQVVLTGLRVHGDALKLFKSPCPVRQPQPDEYCMHVHTVVELQYQVTAGGGAASSASTALAAVEYFAPASYMYNAPHTGRLDGRAKLRLARLAHAFDGMVVPVPHMEWAAAGDDPAAQSALLLGGLMRLLAEREARRTGAAQAPAQR